MRYIAKIEDKSFQIDVEEKDGKLSVFLDGKPVSIDLTEVKPPNFISLLVNHRSFDAEITKDSGKYLVFLGGRRYECILEDERLSRLTGLGGIKEGMALEKELRSPMPGLVVSVEVKEGDQVKSGHGLVIVEAMKMENELKASFDAKVKQIRVKPGQAVEKDEVLIVFE